jgi:hypothetical protein
MNKALVCGWNVDLPRTEITTVLRGEVLRCQDQPKDDAAGNRHASFTRCRPSPQISQISVLPRPAEAGIGSQAGEGPRNEPRRLWGGLRSLAPYELTNQ